MWINEVSSAELFSANRWTVSYFSNTGTATSSAFPMLPLRQIVFERKGASDPQQLGETMITYLGLENVRSLTGELIDFSVRPAQSIKSRSKIFRCNDVLYSRLRPELNKVYLAHGIADEGLCSGEFIVLTPRTDLIIPRYLRHILASSFVTNFTSKLKVGASLPRMATDDLLGLEVPVPPLSIQIELSRRLEEIDAEIVQLRSRLQSLPNSQTQSLMNAIGIGSEKLDI